MPTRHRPRRLTTTTVALVALLGAASPGATGRAESSFPVGGGTAGGGQGAHVGAWASVPPQDLAPPAGVQVSTCTAWTHAADVPGVSVVSALVTTRVEPDGVVAQLFTRDCDGRQQWVWVRAETPESLARAAARSLEIRLLTPPVPRPAPPTRGLVNLETWLAVADPGPVRATAAVPGLSVTTTARIARSTFTFSDGTTVACRGAGQPWTPGPIERPAPCGHRPRRAQPSGTLRVSVEWSVTWVATNGASATLPNVTTLPWTGPYPIGEIQSIGRAG